MNRVLSRQLSNLRRIESTTCLLRNSRLLKLTFLNSYDSSIREKHFQRNKIDVLRKSFTDIANISTNVADKDDFIKPLNLETSSKNDENDNVGEELCGKLDRNQVLRVLRNFSIKPEVKRMAEEVSLTEKMFHEVMISFRTTCSKARNLPTDLHIKLFDLCNGNGNITDLFPFFYRHAKDVYPHLLCLEDLKKISDLREPANWFTNARQMQRRVIYHAGPTNSGKTYSALKSLQEAKTGIYCGPLKLLATEVAEKINNIENKCDLITGDDKRFINEDLEPSTHAACTIEMANLNREYDVAVLDEIQMISDDQRGWAWTRAFLGLCAKEIHICGDATAVPLVEEMCLVTGDLFEVKEYKRLTALNFQKTALESLANVQSGDCIVCFSKADIFNTANELIKRGHEVAVIYGSMPPGVKISQAKRFNDPDDSCKILVATDAIGMGLNLNIKRVIFKSIKKPKQKDTQNTDAEKNEDKNNENYPTNEHGLNLLSFISTSQALQIAGRAGRFNTPFPEGEVTTFKKEDYHMLAEIMKNRLDPLRKAGLHPTIEHIELFAFHLPNHTLTGLLDIFVSLCQIDDSKYFLCNIEAIKYLANLIEQIPLNLRDRYTFACAPINSQMPIVSSCFVKFVRSYSRNELITVDDVCKIIEWPRKIATTTNELAMLESVFDILDNYLWLSYRFPSMFPDVEQIKEMRNELNAVVHKSVKKVVGSKLLGMQFSVEDTRKNSRNTKEMMNRRTDRGEPRRIIENENGRTIERYEAARRVIEIDSRRNTQESKSYTRLSNIIQNDPKFSAATLIASNNDINTEEISNKLSSLLSNKKTEAILSKVKYVEEITQTNKLDNSNVKEIEISDSSDSEHEVVKTINKKLIKKNEGDLLKKKFNENEISDSSESENEDEVKTPAVMRNASNVKDKRVYKAYVNPTDNQVRTSNKYERDMELLLKELIERRILSDKHLLRIIEEKKMAIDVKQEKIIYGPNGEEIFEQD